MLYNSACSPTSKTTSFSPEDRAAHQAYDNALRPEDVSYLNRRKNEISKEQYEFLLAFSNRTNRSASELISILNRLINKRQQPSTPDPDGLAILEQIVKTKIESVTTSK